MNYTVQNIYYIYTFIHLCQPGYQIRIRMKITLLSASGSKSYFYTLILEIHVKRHQTVQCSCVCSAYA